MEWIPILFVIFKGTVLIIGMVYAIKWHYDQDKKEKEAEGSLLPPREMRLFATMIITFALCVIGIVYAGCWGNPANGGRGGALGCVLAFIMSIISKPDAEALADRPEEANATKSDDPNLVVTLQALVEQLHAAFLARLASAEREKIYLGVASFLSAIVWKFGATAASWLNFSN